MACRGRPVTIVLADDHAVVRSGLRMMLEREGGFVIVAEAADADSALQAVRVQRPATLILDLTMPGKLTPLEAIPLARTASPSTRVVLTMHDDPAFARGALSESASAYVLKEAADEELMDAVRRVIAGLSRSDRTRRCCDSDRRAAARHAPAAVVRN